MISQKINKNLLRFRYMAIFHEQSKTFRICDGQKVGEARKI